MSGGDPKVTASVDFDADGKQHGHMTVPYSRDDSAWGSVQLPISVIKNGAGPTIVFTGGNHGDEYEGPIALLKLVRSLDPGEIAGRVIVIPALNYPAVMAGTRVSPIDSVNMNRAYPGKRDGTVTEMIADFVEQKVLPQCDVLFDIHSGGKTLMFSPFAAYHRLDDAGLTGRAREATLALAAPISLELVELDAEGMLDTSVEALGKVFVGSEFGGGGTTTPATVSIAEVAVRNLLAHCGVIDEAPVTREALGLPPARLMHMPEPGCVLLARDSGLYETLVELDTAVAEGDAIGQLHFPERPERDPVVYRAGASGTIIGRGHKVLVEPGDFLALIAHDM